MLQEPALDRAPVHLRSHSTLTQDVAAPVGETVDRTGRRLACCLLLSFVSQEGNIPNRSTNTHVSEVLTIASTSLPSPTARSTGTASLDGLTKSAGGESWPPRAAASLRLPGRLDASGSRVAGGGCCKPTGGSKEDCDEDTRNGSRDHDRADRLRDAAA